MPAEPAPVSSFKSCSRLLNSGPKLPKMASTACPHLFPACLWRADSAALCLPLSQRSSSAASGLLETEGDGFSEGGSGGRGCCHKVPNVKTKGARGSGRKVTRAFSREVLGRQQRQEGMGNETLQVGGKRHYEDLFVKGYGKILNFWVEAGWRQRGFKLGEI